MSSLLFTFSKDDSDEDDDDRVVVVMMVMMMMMIEMIKGKWALVNRRMWRQV